MFLKKISCVFCIKCHIALVTCTHAAVALRSHERDVTAMVSKNKLFPKLRHTTTTAHSSGIFQASIILKSCYMYITCCIHEDR